MKQVAAICLTDVIRSSVCNCPHRCIAGVTLKCLSHEKSIRGEIITELTCLPLIKISPAVLVRWFVRTRSARVKVGVSVNSNNSGAGELTNKYFAGPIKSLSIIKSPPEKSPGGRQVERDFSGAGAILWWGTCHGYASDFQRVISGAAERRNGPQSERAGVTHGSSSI